MNRVRVELNRIMAGPIWGIDDATTTTLLPFKEQQEESVPPHPPVRPRLLALDLDGTLLTPQGTISPATRAALDEAVAQGLILVVATGRTYQMIRFYCGDLPLNGPQITLNGAALVDAQTDQPIETVPLTPEDIWPVVAFLEERGLAVAVFGIEATWIRDTNPYADKISPQGVQQPQRVKAWTDLLGDPDRHGAGAITPPHEPITKIVALAPTEVITQLRPPAEERFGQHLYVTQTSDHLLEFLHAHVSKGTGLAAVAERLGISPTEVVACGDSHNDMTMLTYAGIGVAMGNASAEVKAIADLEAPSNREDGIAWVVKKLFLQ